MEENNIINTLSDPEVSLDQKFYEYCKFYQEYITTPFNDSLEPVISDAVQEFYSEFHIFRTVFALTGGKFSYEISFIRLKEIYRYFSSKYSFGFGGREIETQVKTFKRDFTRNLEKSFKNLLSNPFISDGNDARVDISGLDSFYKGSLPYGYHYTIFEDNDEFPLPPERDWRIKALDISLFSSGRFVITPYLANYIIHDNEG